MIEKEVAENICNKVEEIFRKMEAFSKYINEHCDRSETDRIVKVVCYSIMEFDFKILEPIYKQYPDLKPDFLS